MTGAELAAELASGLVRPAYLLAGREPLLRDDALEVLCSRNMMFSRWGMLSHDVLKYLGVCPPRNLLAGV